MDSENHGAGTDLAPEENTVEDFMRLKDECLREGQLYEDPDFPAHNSSIIRSFEDHKDFITEERMQSIIWKRPKDICDDPKLFLDGHSRFDVKQGSIGNCWFAAAASILASHSHILNQVLPKGQCFKENYAGIFHFKFWQYGRWVTVIVDDRLPFFEERNRLYFMSSTQQNEFWAALLEKAYAKLQGSYKSLEGGLIGNALEDFTGGLAEIFEIGNFENKNKQLFRMMLQGRIRGSLMGCITSHKNRYIENIYGIHGNHAHSVTHVKYIRMETDEGIKKKRMIRVRNPWGKGEWTGAWKDESSEWNNVSEEVKEKLDLKVRDDGEYWMEIKDFCKHFDHLEFCHLNGAVDIDSTTESQWEMSQFQGSWEEGVSAGGCFEFADTFHINPQYQLTLNEYDECDEDDDDDDDDTVIVSLMLKDRRKANIPWYPDGLIGLSIFKVTHLAETSGRFDGSFFQDAKRVAWAPCAEMRTLTRRFQLPAGSYCVVPYMALQGYEGKYHGAFLLRMYTEKRHTANELKH